MIVLLVALVFAIIAFILGTPIGRMGASARGHQI